jgi:hypothetical protein
VTHHGRHFGLVLSFLALAGCGSPLLEHRTKAKPQVRADVPQASSAKANSDSALLRVEAIPEECGERFENSDLCLELEFDEPPSFQAAFRSFGADLKIWDESKDIWFDGGAIPSIYHKSTLECCVPPPIEVKRVAPGRYRLSQIEFHSDGIFDFLVELQDGQDESLRSILSIEVSR